MAAAKAAGSAMGSGPAVERGILVTRDHGTYSSSSVD